MRALPEQTPKLHLFFPRESTLLVSAAEDESIVGDLCPESAYNHPSQYKEPHVNECFLHWAHIRRTHTRKKTHASDIKKNVMLDDWSLWPWR